jgi:histidinol-phosphate aminotransferase
VLRSISEDTRVVYLTDPNNPTGLGIPGGAVEAILAAAPQAMVLVDEAYADFSGRSLIGPLVDRFPNLVVGRTFAKGHGLAALRVGAVIASPSTIRALRSVILPFSVNAAAIAALGAALDDRPYLAWYVAQAAESRERIYACCRRLGLAYWQSEANFVLVRVGSNAKSVVKTMEARGILLRDKSDSPGCDGCIRLTAGVVRDTDRALSALEDTLAARTR